MTRRPEVLAAERMISGLTRSGRLPKAASFSCADCGNPAREYDHYLGYAEEHQLDVEPVCSSCHKKRAWARGEQRITENMVLYGRVCAHGKRPIKSCLPCKELRTKRYRARNPDRIRDWSRERQRRFRDRRAALTAAN